MSERKTGNQNGARQRGRYAGKYWENGANRAGDGDRQGGEPRRAGGYRAGTGARA